MSEVQFSMIRMVDIERLAKNVVWVTCGQILSLAVSVLGIAYIARALGSENFGIYAVFLIFTNVLTILSNLGFHDLIMRDGARVCSDIGMLLGQCLAIQTAFSPLLFLVAQMPIVLGYGAPVGSLVHLAAAQSYIAGLALSVEAVSIANERLEYVTIPQQLGKVVSISMAILTLMTGHGLLGVVFALLVGVLVELSLATVLVLEKLHVRLQLALNVKDFRYIIGEGIRYCPQRILAIVYARSDTFILSEVKGSVITGWYKAARTPFDMLRILPNALAAATYPVISRLGWESPQVSSLTLERFLKSMTILGLALAVGTTILGKHLILLLFGDEYLPAVPALSVLAWTFALVLVARPMIVFLNANHRQGLVTLASAAGAVTTIGLSIIIIPRYGLLGAAFSSFMSQLIVLIACFAGIVAHFFTPNIHAIGLRPLVAAVLMAGLLLTVESFVGTVFAILVGCLGFVLTLVIIGGFDKQDWEIIESVLFMGVVGRLRTRIYNLWVEHVYRPIDK